MYASLLVHLHCYVNLFFLRLYGCGLQNYYCMKRDAGCFIPIAAVCGSGEGNRYWYAFDEALRHCMPFAISGITHCDSFVLKVPTEG